MHGSVLLFYCYISIDTMDHIFTGLAIPHFSLRN
jgi:hypothetical protein